MTIAGGSGQHLLAATGGFAEGEWKAWSSTGGDAARLRFVAALQLEFDSLSAAFPGRVAFGWLDRSQASDTHVLVWANARNVDGAAGTPIVGGVWRPPCRPTGRACSES